MTIIKPEEMNLECSMEDNMSIIRKNSSMLRSATLDAIKDGYYPIVLGGDNTQTLGCFQALKAHKEHAKVLYFDSRVDIKIDPEDKGFFSLDEIVGNEGLFETPEDLVFIGASPDSDAESVRLLREQGVKILDSDACNKHERSLVT
jgi:arginase family enzyme